ncbi:MAG: hypothetical protein KGL36_01575 [Gammaproteobacteria bacterium]|nr:hypothetical protein [Gammaproteobacteria bacterium]
MLPIVLYVLGAALLVGAGVAALTGLFVVFVPQLLLAGVLLIVGLAIERWRYKPLIESGPDGAWTDTGERFVDPASGRLTAVYFDPRDGARHYVVAPRG